MKFYGTFFAITLEGFDLENLFKKILIKWNLRKDSNRKYSIWWQFMQSFPLMTFEGFHWEFNIENSVVLQKLQVVLHELNELVEIFIFSNHLS